MGKRILVADDSLTIQQAFAMVMDGSGYSLTFAKSVDEALAAVKKDGRPDLVLADVALGNGSGYDLCAELKADAVMREAPVFILASGQSPYDETRGRKVGADGHMAKPFESQALLDAIASALAAPARRPASGEGSALPDFTDSNDNTARIAAHELPAEDDDSYGEITIERGPVPTPPAPAWSTKPPTRPTGRSIPAASAPAAPTSPPAQPSPRPSLIPGTRPSGSMPAVRTGSAPQPLPVSPTPTAAARPQPARTMMGFPSVKPPLAGKAPAPVAPPKPTTAAPAVAPARAPGAPSAPLEPTASAPARAAAIPTPAVPTSARPVAPRPSPFASAAVPSPVPMSRRAPTPIPSTAPIIQPMAPAPSFAAAAVVSSVANQIDQKVAALAARGPEYEAIAKLSREIIEQVVWEVVPELAEAIIRQEVDRLASAKK